MNTVRKFAISLMTLGLFLATHSFAQEGTYL